MPTIALSVQVKLDVKFVKMDFQKTLIADSVKMIITIMLVIMYAFNAEITALHVLMKHIVLHARKVLI